MPGASVFPPRRDRQSFMAVGRRQRTPTEVASLFGFELANPAVELPQLYVMTIYKLFGLFLCGLVGIAEEVDPLLNVTIRAYEVGVVSDHFGGARPGEVNHSLM